MVILGITDSFTSGAAIIVDGRIVAAVNEERLTRQKMCMGFPGLSIAEVMDIAGVDSKDIDQVAVATSHLFWRPEAVPYSDYFREKKDTLRDTFLGLGSKFSVLVGDIPFARESYYQLKRKLTKTRQWALPALLCERFGITAPVRFLDHHLCHAAAAYYTAGFDDATIVTQDGAGDGKCSRVYAIRKGEFKLLQSLDSYDSVGNYYSYVTHLCGFKAHKHEGKITGLAAYGEPEYVDLLEKFISFDGAAIHNTGRCFDHSAIRKLERALPAGFSEKNLSASMQAVLERSVTAYCDYWIQRSGIPNLALAGGVFANVKLNERVHDLDAVNRIFVHPGMGDDGLAVGAALFLHGQAAGYRQAPSIKDVYLGRTISDNVVAKDLVASGLKPFRPDVSIAKAAASLLAAGKVVARCAGRMEYGPRALGNRTIMYQTTDPTVNHWLNERLDRTEFMPFAPVTMWEYRDECYKRVRGAEDTARFMTITFDCSTKMSKQSPAVCHVDNTARPQLIRERDNPEYYAILHEYHALTGIPSVINTSFNIHDEPIVNTAAEALQAFRQSKLDALILGDCIVLSPSLDGCQLVSAA